MTLYDDYDYTPMDFSNQEYATVIREMRKIAVYHLGLQIEDEIPKLSKGQLTRLKGYITEKIVNLPKKLDYYLGAALFDSFIWNKLMMLERRGTILYVNLTRKIIELQDDGKQIQFLDNLLKEDVPISFKSINRLLANAKGKSPSMDNLEIENRELRNQNLNLRCTIQELKTKLKGYKIQLQQMELRGMRQDEKIGNLQVELNLEKHHAKQKDSQRLKLKENLTRKINEFNEILTSTSERNNALEIALTQKQSEHREAQRKVEDLERKNRGGKDKKDTAAKRRSNADEEREKNNYQSPENSFLAFVSGDCDAAEAFVDFSREKPQEKKQKLEKSEQSEPEERNVFETLDDMA